MRGRLDRAAADEPDLAPVGVLQTEVVAIIRSPEGGHSGIQRTVRGSPNGHRGGLPVDRRRAGERNKHCEMVRERRAIWWAAGRSSYVARNGEATGGERAKLLTILCIDNSMYVDNKLSSDQACVRMWESC
jgi:hypothetical protein